MPEDLVAFLVATSFAAGLNVYATVATLGLLGQAGWLSLPPALHILSSWYVIAASALLFLVEFFADKIPAFDLIWNALHTFIRVPIAALLAYRATAQLSPSQQIICTIVGGAIAFAAHGGKTAMRAAVTPSPEPFSNIGLSLGEDVTAVGLVCFASKHPYVAAAVVACFLIVIVSLTRWIFRTVQALFRGGGRGLDGPVDSRNSA